MSGKEIRLKRIFSDKSNNVVIVPMDHGATEGPIRGIERIGNIITKLQKPYVDAVVICKG